ncbi:MAG TPA: heme-binding domain-containing protein [Terracidiphilus sp.]|jgi:cytochrome c
MWSKAAIFVASMLALSVGLSFAHPWGDVRHASSNDEILGGIAIPSNVRSTIETKCADCHSNRTHWPIYSRLAPGSWLMEHDVNAARTAMNLSQWNGMPVEGRIAALTRIAAEVRTGQMPPGPYALMHPANRLTDDDKQQIATWARAERKRLRATNEEKETSKQ